MSKGRGYRLFQVQKSGNRHLVDLGAIGTAPLTRRIAQVLVLAPEELIARKVIAYHQRRGQPKSGTDWRDLAVLLLTFPELKTDSSPVVERLKAAGASSKIISVWYEVITQEIKSPSEDDEFA